MANVKIVSSYRSVSLSKVAEDIAHVLSDNGITVDEVMGYPVMDPYLYEGLDGVIIVMTFDPSWIVPYAYLYRMLRVRGVRAWFYTTVEGNLRRVAGDEWIYRDLRLIANSRYTFNKLAKVGAKVDEVIYHGIDTNEAYNFRYMADEVRNDLGLSRNDFVVGYLSAGYIRKGHELFARVVDKLRKEDPSIYVVVLTDSKGKDYYKDVEDIIIVDQFGKLSKPWIYGFYHSLNAYVHPSLSEGFGLPVLEALSCGKLVIHPDYEPLSEITTPETSIRVRVVDVRYVMEAGSIMYELHIYSERDMVEAIKTSKKLISEKGNEVSQLCMERARKFDLHNTYKRFVEIIVGGEENGRSNTVPNPTTLSTTAGT